MLYKGVMDLDWDVLIVLDACRYDYFSKVYSEYFEGDLEEMYSKGTTTYEWLVNSFPGIYKDTVYVSSNPHICGKQCVWGFCAGEKFHHVVDVWDRYWNEELGTVLPMDVTIEALKAFYRYPGKRLIIHYLQPHAPYLTCRTGGFLKPTLDKRDLFYLHHPLKNTLRYRAWLKMRTVINYISINLFDMGKGIAWKLGELMNLPPESPLDACRRLYGVEGLRRCYLENLIKVLEASTPLVDDLLSLGAEVVITSDHGEFLGERWSYGHWPGSKRPILRIVPWFKVDKVRKVVRSTRYSLTKRIVKRVSHVDMGIRR